MRCLALVFVALFVATGSSLGAQEAPVAPGTRVRVQSPPQSSGWVVGTIVGWEGESLVLEPEQSATPLTFARGQITRFDVYGGQKSNAGKGALIGLGAGLVTGFTVGLIACSGDDGTACNTDTQDDNRFAYAAVLGLGGAVLGTGIGALIGVVAKSDRWEAVPLDRIRVSFTPVYDGQPGLALSVSF